LILPLLSSLPPPPFPLFPPSPFIYGKCLALYSLSVLPLMLSLLTEATSMITASSCCVKLEEVLSGLKKKAKTLDIHVHFCGFSQRSFFFPFHLGFNNPCITVYGIPFLADNSKYVAALLFFKACTKGYVVNTYLANSDNEAVSHSATCSTNLGVSWGVVMLDNYTPVRILNV